MTWTCLEARVGRAVEAVADYLPLISHHDATTFEGGLLVRLEELEELDVCSSWQRDLLRKYCFELCAFQLDQSALLRRIRRKPLGYPGDYRVIDWLITRRLPSPGVGRRWDDFGQRLAPSRALRERVRFIAAVFRRLRRSRRRAVSILGLASGSYRDIQQALLIAGELAVGTTLHGVEDEARALRHAGKLLERLPGVSCRWEVNTFRRFEPRERYDLVWLPGVFCCWREEPASRLLASAWRWLEPGGVLAFACARSDGLSRIFMEWCLDWRLVYRDESDLRRLWKRAGLTSAGMRLARTSGGALDFVAVVKKS